MIKIDAVSVSCLLRLKSQIYCSKKVGKINTDYVKGSDEDEMGIIYFKSDTCDLVLACDHLQIIMLYTGYVIQAYFTLTFLTKYIVIFRIWMDN